MVERTGFDALWDREKRRYMPKKRYIQKKRYVWNRQRHFIIDSGQRWLPKANETQVAPYISTRLSPCFGFSPSPPGRGFSIPDKKVSCEVAGIPPKKKERQVHKETCRSEK